MVKIWRVYNNGHIKNETHVLKPHIADGQRCTGYDGDVSAWSAHNQKWRFGCAQIIQPKGEMPKAIYAGYLGQDQLDVAIAKIAAKEIE